MRNVYIPYEKAPYLVQPWQGESLHGKSIVVQMEQGHGDIIMFARFLPMLKMLGASKVVLLQNKSFHHLLGQLDCVDVLCNDRYDQDAKCDYWIGSLSLPYYLGFTPTYVRNLFPITKQKIVASEGYLEAEPSNLPRKIGVNWQSSKNNLHFIRSVDKDQMYEWVGGDVYSLNPESDGDFVPLPDDGWKTDWAKTAKHMKSMKGVVTVDTSTAHLAGALGVKCVVLMPIPKFECWRWKNGRWYDSVTILKCDEYHKIPEIIGDW